MVDELDRLRQLRDEAPPPGTPWVEDTRDELLAMADEEAAAAVREDHVSSPSAWERVLDGLAVAIRRPAVVAASVLLVAAAGWGVYELVEDQPDRDPTVAQQPGTPTSSSAPVRPELAARCASPDGGYAVSYPGDWNTDTGETAPGCQVFDPEPMELEEGIGGPGGFGAITIRTVAAPIEVARDPGPAATLLSAEETTVDGRSAVRQVIEHTGETSIPEGVRAYRYLVEREGGALLAITYDTGEPAFDRKREILDEMMRTIELEPGG